MSGWRELTETIMSAIASTSATDRRRFAVGPVGSPHGAANETAPPSPSTLRKCLETLLVGSSPDRLADCFNEFVFVGEGARLELGIEFRTSHRKLEAAACGRNHDKATDGALVTS